MKKNISDAEIGDTIYTYDVSDNPYTFKVVRIESQTEGGSTKWGRVFYDKNNHFITEMAIPKVNGIFSDSIPIERKGFAVTE